MPGRYVTKNLTRKDRRIMPTPYYYVLEVYSPAYPQSGTIARIHKGTFNEIRDSLSPCMKRCHGYIARNLAEARVKARECIKNHGYTDVKENFRRLSE